MSIRSARLLFLLAFLPVALWCAPVPARAQALTEEQVKAAYLYNFAKFVEWPESAFSGAAAPLRICVVGDEAMVEALQPLAGKEATGRPVSVTSLPRGGDPEGCHILFVSAGEWRGARALLEGLGRRPVLTVSDRTGFAEGGGVVQFLVEENRVRFAINPDAGQRAGLKISSRLLQLAQIVQEGKP